MTAFLLIVAILLSLGASAFFSGVETGLLSVSRERILHLAREGGRKAKMVQEALSDMGRATTTILIGNNLANVSYSSASSALIFAVITDSQARSIAAFIAAFIVLYVSEFLPKLFFSARPLQRTLFVAPAYRSVATLLAPLATLALKVTNLFVGRKTNTDKHKMTPNELLRILQDRKDGVCLTDFESALITRIIVLRIKGQPITREAIYSALLDSDQ